MGTHRRLLFCLGSLLVFLVCIQANEDDWDSVDQDYGEINVSNFKSEQLDDDQVEDAETVQQQSDGQSERVKILTTPAPEYRSANPYHNSRICSTFGNYHYKTFDGDIFHFPGDCNYQFVRHCKSNYEEFNIQIRRAIKLKTIVIAAITMKIEGVDIVLAEKSVLVNNEQQYENLPFSVGGLQISKSGTYMRVQSTIGMQMVWNEEDSLTLELNQKFANQTCGLCGDYNGIPLYNEFIVNNAQISHRQFGNLHKFNGPQERCEDTKEEEEEEKNCPKSDICQSVLTSKGLRECNQIVDIQKYVELCEKDLCRCKANFTGFCLCNIFTEYSRQCTHAGGKPKNWRTAEICPLKCHYNLKFGECGTACPDTCTDPERSLVCDEHCTDGCFCPPGTVFDDISKTGCIPKESCSCTYNGEVYPPGKGYSEKCQECTCQGGKWNCVKKACFGICSLEGGSHITTFDLTRYNFFGDCIYTLVKTCHSGLFSVLADLEKCGLTDTETCLKSISLSLNGGKEFILLKKCGSVYVNSIYTQLPMSTATVTIYKPTSFYIVIQTRIGIQIQIQLVPTMQIYVLVDPKFMSQTCGLCGNFNDIQADDFKSPSGVIEGTGSSFGNLWKTQLDCPNVKNNFEHPCDLSGENEKYASHWCDMLLANDGPFASCHKTVDPEDFHKNCMFDTCNCEKQEECMCAALSSYVNKCSRSGIDLRGWRTNVCHSYTTSCPPSFVYSYTVSTCLPTCRSLSEPDDTCKYDIDRMLDGCICEDGKYLNEEGHCVLPALCSCYYKGTTISHDDFFHDNGAICTCTNGKLECVGVNPVDEIVCEAPMVHFDCDNATEEAKQTACQKSCATYDVECHSSHCVSGCVCPDGLVYDDGSETCIRAEECPCTLNDDFYSAGETIKVKCNTCTCRGRKWECTKNTCLGSCAVYGDGHYTTFDSRKYRFNGNCWYTLAQDYCKGNDTDGTFRVITENSPCGSSGTTCTKSIRLYLGNYELILSNQKFDVVKKNYGQYIPFKVRQMGLYLVMEAANGLALVWDKKTTIMIKLDPKFEGKTCGLCGDYDGNAANDYLTRSQAVVGDVIEFGNSWKLSQRCPNAVEIKDTCVSNPYRKAWSQKQCSIITSGTFASCHALVDPLKYYESCVNDACACNRGGDCDCFCTAVAAYAQACSEAGQCVSWRTPNICPVFCDFYNRQGHCEWHYKTCGAPCMKTCMNPSGVCLNNLIGLEGCYPACPPDRPYFDEESMRCVSSCHCYDEYGTEFKPGQKMPSTQRCSICECTQNGRECTQAKECCKYEGKEFLPGDTIYYTADGIGGCIYAICSDNSTVKRLTEDCPTTTKPPTTFDFTPPAMSTQGGDYSTPPGSDTSSSESTPATSTEKPSSTPGSETPGSSTGITGTPAATPTGLPTCVEAYDCTWSEWYDVSKPENGDGDMERFEDIEAQGYKVCKNPNAVDCRAKEYPNQSLKELGQDVTCSRKTGLVCLNSKNEPMCYNYQIRIQCCSYRKCTSTPSGTATTGTEVSYSRETISVETPASTSTKPPTALPIQSTSGPETSKFPSSAPTISTSAETSPSSASPTTTCVYKMECRWTPWYDNNEPNTISDGGEIENVKNITSEGIKVCTAEEIENKIECEAVDDKDIPIVDNNQRFSCDIDNGLICKNREQTKKDKCHNYRIRIECCAKYCEPIQTPTISTIETTEQTTTSRETTSQGTTTRSPETLEPGSTKSPSSAPSTSTLSTKTPEPITTIGSTTAEVTPSPTTICVYKMECRWTPWYDNNKPILKSDGGDSESVVETESKGIEVCTDKEVKDKIECEAIDSEGTTIVDNNQKVSCTLNDGLSCKNREQIKKEKCHNYRIRVLCCAEVCESVQTTIITTTETSESTTTGVATTTHGTIKTSTSQTKPTKFPTTGKPSTEKPGSEPSSPSESTPSTSSSSEITTSTSPTTACVHRMECRWTPWYDVNRPTQQSDGGDSESPEELKSKGYEICRDPEVEHKIQCEAIDHQGVTIANNQQILTCVLGIGLTCKNSDQKSKEKCHNYRIRVDCCASYCDQVVSTISTSTVTQSSTPSSVITARPPTSSVTEPGSSTENCDKVRASECRWTEWFNENKPSADKDGEDIENSENLKAKGIDVCKQGEIENQIECKAEQYSELNYENTVQKATCSVKEGLICRNKDQTGEKCHDYSIRIECCSENFVKSCGKSTTPSSTEVTSIPTTISVTEVSSPGSETSPPSTISTGTKIPVTSSETTQSTSSSPSSSEITSSPTTACIKKMECRWTPWYDANAPNPKGDGGDSESPEDIKTKGYEICAAREVENKIECEAIDKEGLVILNNQQKTTCNLQSGLTCLNKEQKKKEKCYNYRIRFECCAEYCEKIETPTTSGTATTTSTTTLNEPSSTGKPQTSTSLPTSKPSSTTISVTEPGSPTSEDCKKFRKEECYWTGWFNKETPTSDINGGDNENSNKLKDEGIEVCKQDQIENQIECKAEQYADLSAGRDDQTYTCDLKKGLVCKNKDQPGEKCNDYSIRIECCSEKFVKFCGGSTISPTSASSTEITTIQTTTSVTEPSSPESSVPASQSSTDETYTKSPTHTTGVTSSPTTTSSTTKTEGTSSQPSTTTSCEKFRQNECRWTEWLNLNTPSSDINGEERESLDELRSRGLEVCKNEETENQIECRADQYPNMAYEDIKQISKCNVKEGLICKNQEQESTPKQCLDYAIRIECCSKKFIESCGKSTPSPTSPSSSEVTISPSTTSVTELFPPSSISSKETSTPGSTKTSEISTSGETPATSSTSTTKSPGSTTSVGTTLGSPSSQETSKSTITSSTETTTSTETSTPSSLVPSETSTGTPSPATCNKLRESECRWTEYHNVNKPSSDSNGEDRENLDELRSRGKDVCKEEEVKNKIECQAVKYPELSHQDIGQVLTCNVKDGLVCKNGEQTDESKPCLDYAVRVECCSKRFIELCGDIITSTDTPGSTTSEGYPGSTTTGSSPGTAPTSGSPSTSGTSTSVITSSTGSPEPGKTPTTKSPSSVTSKETSTPIIPSSKETSTSSSPSTAGTSTPGSQTPEETSSTSGTTTKSPGSPSTIGTSTPGSQTPEETSSTSGTSTTEAPGSSSSVGTTTPGSQSPGETTSATGTSTTKSPGSPSSTETSTSTGTSTPSTLVPGETSTGTPSPSTCNKLRESECRWTEYHNVNKPSSDSNGEDRENLDELRSRGKDVCKEEEVKNKIECQAVKFPELSHQDIGQVLTCNVKDGLVCKNGEQIDESKPCLDYAVRVECCSKRFIELCGDIITSTETPGSTTSEGYPGSTTTGSSPGTAPTSGSPSTSGTSTSVITSSTGSTEPGKTPTTKSPSSVTSKETSTPIIPSSKETSTSSSPSTVGSSTPGSQTPEETSSTSGTTTKPPGSPSTIGTSTPGSQTPEETSSTSGTSTTEAPGSSSSVGTTTPGSQTPEETSSTSGTSTTEAPGSSSSVGTTTPGSQSPGETTSATGTSTTKSPGSPSSTETSTSTGTSTPSTLVPGEISTGTPSPSTCNKLRESECRWTEYHNINEPSSDSNGEDRENLDELRARGKDVCKEEEVKNKIQCQAVKYPELPHQDIGQVLTCNVKDGLVCKNGEQIDESKPCLDYAVRVECCSKRFIEFCGEIITSTETPGSTTSEGYPGSTTTGSSPGTAPTSSSPSTSGTSTSVITSSTGSTEPGKTPTTKSPSSVTSKETSTPIIPSSKETSTSSSPSTVGSSTPGSQTPEETSSTSGTTTKPPGSPSTIGTSTPGSQIPEETSSTSGTSTTEAPGSSSSVGTTTPGSQTPEETSSTSGTSTTEAPGSSSSVGTTTPGSQSPGETTSATGTSTTKSPGSPSSTETSTSTGTSTPSTLVPGETSTGTPSPSTCNKLRESECRWTEYHNINKPSSDSNGEDRENLDELRARGKDVCKEEEVKNKIECQAVKYPELPHQDIGQVLTCNVKDGLVCKNGEQIDESKPCLDYAVRVECCSKRFIEFCGEIITSTETPGSTTSEGYPESTTTGSSPGTAPSSSSPSTSGTSTSVITPSTGSPEPGKTPTTKSPSSVTSKETSTPIIPSSKETSTSSSPSTVGSSTPGSQTPEETSSTSGTSTTEAPGSPSTIGTSTPGSQTPEETSSTSGTSTTKAPGSPSTIGTSTPGSQTPEETSSTSGTSTTEAPGSSSSVGTTTPGSQSPGETTSATGTSTTKSPGSPSSTETSTSTGTSTPSTLVPGETSTGTPSPSTCNKLRESECRWTEYHNVNKPSSDSNGEDRENLDELRSRGKDVCKEEEVKNKIECQAVKFPELSHQDIGQVLTCNMKDGLVCKNSEQTDESKPCLDYAVRVECCSKKFIESCGDLTTSPSSTSQIPGTTPGVSTEEKTTESPTGITSTSISGTDTSTITVTSTSGTTVAPIGTSPHTTSSTSTTSSTIILATTSGPEMSTSPSTSEPTKGSTVHCFCQIKDRLFSPGDIIYKTADKEGCVFYAVCSLECKIERYLGECSTPGTTPQATITSEERTVIMNITSGKPTFTRERPSKVPPTKPLTPESIESLTTPEGKTESADLYKGFVDKIPLDHQPKQEVQRSSSLEGLGGTHETEACGPCECLMPTCGTGYRIVSFMPPGACCANISCEPDSVCVVENTIYQPGSTIPQPKNVCQTCECSKDDQDTDGFYAVKCQELQCDKTCKEGYAYAEKEGECCGECVPKQCTINVGKGEKGEDEKPVQIKIGESYRPEGSTCSYYECVEENDKPVLTKVKKVCQELDISKCEEGTVEYDDERCCQTCTLKTEVKVVEKPVVENCTSRKEVTVFKEGDCEIEVELTYCGGPCMGTSKYSMTSQDMSRGCSCCTELEVANREVEMLCANGQRRVYHYKDVVRCGCSKATCEPASSAEVQTQDQQQAYQTAFN